MREAKKLLDAFGMTTLEHMRKKEKQRRERLAKNELSLKHIREGITDRVGEYQTIEKYEELLFNRQTKKYTIPLSYKTVS